MLFLSTMQVKFERLYFPANATASQWFPSWCSASEVKQNTLNLAPSILAAYAYPAAWARPEPRGPEVVSIPTSFVLSGCPWRPEPNFLKVLSFDIGKKPR